ncbi:MAG TPA: DUF1508 domain-containing protein, partial [Abditibacteriaceae bacterium]
MKLRVECNEGSSGAWTWRIKQGNGDVVATGAKVYETQAACIKSAETFADAVGVTDVVYVPLNPE